MPTKFEHRGLLYCAVGAEYLSQAETSFQSALSHNPELNGSVYSNIIPGSNIWDRVLQSKTHAALSRENEMIHKLDAILDTPYNYTIYLDSDTYVLDNIADIFTLLTKFDLVLCHGHDRNKRHTLIKDAVDDENNSLFSKDIPYGFVPIQGGLIAYNIEKTRVFFQLVRNTFLAKGYYDDQAVIRELLWESNLSFYVLPSEYNFNSIAYLKNLKKLHYREARPKIFHYTQNKGEDIGRLVGKYFNKNEIDDWKKNKTKKRIPRIASKIKRKIRHILFSLSD